MIPALVLAALLVLLLWVCAAAPAPVVAPTAGTAPPPGRRGRSRPDALDVARMVERLATVLGSGVSMPEAWSSVARSLPPGELAEFSRRLAAGSTPRAAAGPALRGLGEVASLQAALDVCARTGAPASGVLLSLAQALRDLHDAQLARGSAFAGPRSTARILLVLPLAGIALGTLIGVDPVGVLLGTPSGRALLVIGCALTAAGWWWMHRLLRAASGRPRVEVDPSVVLELIAGPLVAGVPLAGAVRAVGEAIHPTAAGARLCALAAALTAGVGPEAATRELGPSLAPLREAALLAHGSGADLAQILRSSAADSRRMLARGAEAAAARLAVRLVLPTGLTLLPAFVVLGIIPTLSSLLGGAFEGGTLLSAGP
ncbi:type II secretion system F family protein [Brachybacterium phenoliresistens]|uniref:type II secretion system F family protein n=1 Tax=Brachybacterium phenoliresistens TaxID=396014 RepID=UPI0031DB9112